MAVDDQADAPKDQPDAIPRRLKEEGPTVKLLWAWLRGQGWVSYSVRDIEQATGVSFKAAHNALIRLRELNYLEDVGESKERERGVYRVRGKV